MKIKRFVLDTNTLISAALLPGSANNEALKKAYKTGVVVASAATFAEVQEVISRKKFDKYLTEERKIQFIQKLEQDIQLCEVGISISACRDAKNNKFLELAIEADAACIITGDKDLLTLHPFQNIPILSASDFLKSF